MRRGMEVYWGKKKGASVPPQCLIDILFSLSKCDTFLESWDQMRTDERRAWFGGLHIILFWTSISFSIQKLRTQRETYLSSQKHYYFPLYLSSPFASILSHDTRNVCHLTIGQVSFGCQKHLDLPQPIFSLPLSSLVCSNLWNINLFYQLVRFFLGCTSCCKEILTLRSVSNSSNYSNNKLWIIRWLFWFNCQRVRLPVCCRVCYKSIHFDINIVGITAVWMLICFVISINPTK